MKSESVKCDDAHDGRMEKRRKKREAEEEDKRNTNKSEADEFAALRRQRRANNVSLGSSAWTEKEPQP